MQRRRDGIARLLSRVLPAPNIQSQIKCTTTAGVFHKTMQRRRLGLEKQPSRAISAWPISGLMYSNGWVFHKIMPGGGGLVSRLRSRVMSKPSTISEVMYDNGQGVSHDPILKRRVGIAGWSRAMPMPSTCVLEKCTTTEKACHKSMLKRCIGFARLRNRVMRIRSTWNNVLPRRRRFTELC